MTSRFELSFPRSNLFLKIRKKPDTSPEMDLPPKAAIDKNTELLAMLSAIALDVRKISQHLTRDTMPESVISPRLSVLLNIFTSAEISDGAEYLAEGEKRPTNERWLQAAFG